MDGKSCSVSVQSQGVLSTLGSSTSAPVPNWSIEPQCLSNGKYRRCVAAARGHADAAGVPSFNNQVATIMGRTLSSVDDCETDLASGATVCYQHDPLGLAHAHSNNSRLSVKLRIRARTGCWQPRGTQVAIMPPWAPHTVFDEHAAALGRSCVSAQAAVTGLAFAARAVAQATAKSKKESTSPNNGGVVVTRLAITTDNHEGRLFIWMLHNGASSTASASSPPVLCRLWSQSH